MPDTAFTFPQVGENRGTGTAWTNPGNITADDNNVAQVTITTAGGQSQYLVARQFGFNLQNANILGVTVQVSCNQIAPPSGIAFPDEVQLEVRLRNNAGTLVGNTYTQTISGFEETVSTFGGATDTWAAGLGLSDVNSTNFGVELRLTQQISYPFAIDWVKIRISYEIVNSANLTAQANIDVKTTHNGSSGLKSIGTYSVLNSFHSSAAISGNSLIANGVTRNAAASLNALSAKTATATQNGTTAWAALTGLVTRTTFSGGATNLATSNIATRNTFEQNAALQSLSNINARNTFLLSASNTASAFITNNATFLVAAALVGLSFISNGVTHSTATSIRSLSTLTATPEVSCPASIRSLTLLAAPSTMSGSAGLSSRGLYQTNNSFEAAANITANTTIAGAETYLGFASWQSTASITDNSGTSWQADAQLISTSILDVKNTFDASSSLSANSTVEGNNTFGGTASLGGVGNALVPTPGTSIEWLISAGLTSAAGMSAFSSVGSDVSLTSIANIQNLYTLGIPANLFGMAHLQNAVTFDGNAVFIGSGLLSNDVSFFGASFLSSIPFIVAANEYVASSRLQATGFIQAAAEQQVGFELGAKGFISAVAAIGSGCEMASLTSIVTTASTASETSLAATSQITIVSQTQASASLVGAASVLCALDIGTTIDWYSKASLTAIGSGGEVVILGTRGIRFGILGRAWGVGDLVNGSASLLGMGSIAVQNTLVSPANLTGIGSISADTGVFGTADLNAQAFMYVTFDDTFTEGCECPPWNSDDTPDNQFVQKQEQSSNPWKKKNCE